MAIGDLPDVINRLRRVLPARWFPDSPPGGPSVTPVLDAVLSGFAWSWSWLYSLLTYANLQTRISTATDQFLDIIALDFLGSRIVRRPNQSDDSFRARIEGEILRPRVTRGAVISALTDLTGRAPQVFEPANPYDAGGYNIGPPGYGIAGGYGSLALPYQVFITAYRPHIGGVVNVDGYNGSVGGYGIGAIEYTTLGFVGDAVTDEDIYDAIAASMPAAGVAWTSIQP